MLQFVCFVMLNYDKLSILAKNQLLIFVFIPYQVAIFK
jgi:hypothetical protein